jgi:3-dehydroquinate dehydratase / shikimate dehydrogenase
MIPEIEHLRTALQERDDQLVRLLDERARLSRAMGREKGRRDWPVLDPAQEARVLARVCALSDGSLPPTALRAIYAEVLAASRDLQTEVSGRVCVSVVPDSVPAAAALLGRAFAVSSLVELRLDLLAEADLAALLSDRPGRIIVTDRAAREGGLSPRHDAERVARLAEAVRQGADLVDLEADTAAGLVSALRTAIQAAGGRTRLILSWHDAQGTPGAAELAFRFARARDLGADIVKLVTTAHDPADVARVLALHATARACGQPLVAFCMGGAGSESRLRALRLGSVFGYASLEAGGESAPGQLTVAQMRDGARYAVLGRPARHSLSPLLFNAAFAARGMKARYDLREPADVGEAVGLLRGGEYDGASVTLPFKTGILPLLDDVTEDARRLGAVNTVTVDGGRLLGANTDWRGLIACLRERVALAGTTVAVLGAGGAARAAVYGLQREDGVPVVVCRDPDRGRDLARDLGCDWRPLADLAGVPAQGLINATPVGLAPHADASPVAAAALARFAWVMDTVYTPRRTRLLADAEAAGCLAIPGLGMLVHQAAAQFALWTGREAPVAVMAAVAAGALDWREGEGGAR